MDTQNKLSASLEDYLEAIYLISKEQGVARSKGIMKHLQVTGSSVTEALQQLCKKDLINYTPYDPITLTSKGRKVALDVRYRHEALRDFFIEVLGVDVETADEGACKMEHVASANIIERMVEYTRYLKTECTKQGCGKISCFESYLQQIDK